MKTIKELGVFDVWMPVAREEKDQIESLNCIGVAKMINPDNPDVNHHYYKDDLSDRFNIVVVKPHWWPEEWLPEKAKAISYNCGMRWSGSGLNSNYVNYNDDRVVTPTPWGGPAWCVVWNFGQRNHEQQEYGWDICLVIGKTVYNGVDKFVIQEGGGIIFKDYAEPVEVDPNKGWPSEWIPNRKLLIARNYGVEKFHDEIISRDMMFDRKEE